MLLMVRSSLLLLFLPALSSCVPKGVGGASISQQALEVKSSSISASGRSKTDTSTSHSPEKSAGMLTSAGQESDINREISPYGTGNTVSIEAEWPGVGREAGQLSHAADIIGLFSADPSRSLALSVDREGQVMLWNSRSGGSARLFSLAFQPEAVALHPSRRLLAVSHAATVSIVSAVTGEHRARLKNLRTRAASLAFQPDGNALLIGGADGEVYRWKFTQPGGDTAKSLERYFAHANVVSSVAFHPAGRVFFSGDWGGALNAWLPYDADQFGGVYDENLFGQRAFSDQSTRMRAPRSSSSSIEHLQLTADGESLFAGSQDGTLEWWRVRGFTLLASVAAHKGLMYALAVSPSGQRIASAGRDGKLQIWKLRTTKDAASNTETHAIELERSVESSGVISLQFIDDHELLQASKAGQVTTLSLG